MTIALCLLLVLLLAAQQLIHVRQVNIQIAQAAAERAKLLDRIQHPQVRQVQPGEQKEYDPPKDTAEMAWVGQEVPEFIQVGDNGTPS